MRSRKKCIALLMVVLILLHSLFLTAAAESTEELSAGDLGGMYCALVDVDTGKFIFSKNVDAKIYPASTTKIMTLLLACESGIPMDQMITIPAEANSVPSDSSLIPVYAGETMTFADLLYGFQIQSGNDGGMAIAILVSGSVADFVQKMNDRAAQLGCTNTHFANPHGYHSDNHYTTVTDLSKITIEALKNSTFRKIVSTAEYTMAATEKRGSLTLYSKFELFKSNSEYYYADCIGIKTGYTSKAGYCFVGAMEHDGLTLLTLTMNSGSAVNTYRWSDTIKMFNYGLSKYTFLTLDSFLPAISADYTRVTVQNAAGDDPEGGSLVLNVVPIEQSRTTIPVYNDSESYYTELNTLRSNTVVSMAQNIMAPIEEGQVVGTLKIALNDKDYVTASLVASRSVAKKEDVASVYDVFPFLAAFSNPLVKLLMAILIVLVLLLIIIGAYKRHLERERKRRLYEKRRKAYLKKKRLERERRNQSSYDDYDDYQ